MNYGSEVYVKYNGSITIVTSTAAVASPDPEIIVAVDLHNRTKITLINGEVNIADTYNYTATLSAGQATTTHPDEPMNQPSQATYEEWWTKFTRPKVQQVHFQRIGTVSTNFFSYFLE